MQRRYKKKIPLLGLLAFPQTATAQITDGAQIFSGGDIGTILVNFIDVITLVEIDTIAQTALFSAVVATFYFASLNIFEQVFLRLEEIIKEALEGDSRRIHGTDEYPTGVKGMAFAVAFISANGLTGLIGLLAATAMGLTALLIVLIMHGKFLGLLTSLGIRDPRSYPEPTSTPPDPEPRPEPEPEPKPDPEPGPTTTPPGPDDGPTSEPESPEAELVFEYLDDMRKFRQYVNNRYDRKLSMDPFSTSSGFSGSAHSGKLNLDHSPLEVAEFIAKLTRQPDQFKNAVNSSNVSAERKKEVVSEINKTIRLYIEVERGKLEND